MKRTIEFWQRKLDRACEQVRLHSIRANYLSSDYNCTTSFILPMKKLYGHALNRDYTGYKIFARRKTLLKKRLVYRTRIAILNQKVKQLTRTKIPFYVERINSLGGQPKFPFGWEPK